MDLSTQIMFWGYAVLGDTSNSIATISELRGEWEPSVISEMWWDRTTDYLDSLRLYDGSKELPVPEKWACWWIGEYERRAA